MQFLSFQMFFKVIDEVNILCIHSLICPLLYFKLKTFNHHHHYCWTVESASPGRWMKKTFEYFHQLSVRESSPVSYSCSCVSCPCPCRTCCYRTSVLHVGLTSFTGLKSACVLISVCLYILCLTLTNPFNLCSTLTSSFSLCPTTASPLENSSLKNTFSLLPYH